MSRKVRALFVIVVLSFAFSAAACADGFGPHGWQCADTNGSGTCY
jgi:hypothetical protein